MKFGNCFQAASRLQDRMARDGRDALLVQAMVDTVLGPVDWHSWCEFDGSVYDRDARRYTRAEAARHIVRLCRYTVFEP